MSQPPGRPPTGRAGRWGWPWRRRAARGSIPGTRGTATFKDLIDARRALLTNDSDATRQAYQERRAEFVAGYGELEDVYWGKDMASGVAITAGSPGRRARLHTITDEATADDPDIAAAIQDWQILAVRAPVLPGESALVCLRWVLAGVTYLLATVIAHKRALEATTTSAIMERQKTALANANAYYVANASRRAHVTYFWGMIVGAVVNALLALGILLLLHWAPGWLWGIDITARQEALGLAAVVAGALGAMFSVLLRVTSGRFALDYEVDAGKLLVLGSFRPFVGAVSGLAIYVALGADFLSVKGEDSFFVIAFLAFLAGFSERFARDAFGRAERTAFPATSSTGPPPAPSGGSAVALGAGSLLPNGPPSSASGAATEDGEGGQRPTDDRGEALTTPAPAPPATSGPDPGRPSPPDASSPSAQPPPP